MASHTKENYIKAIYFLHLKSEEISLSDLGNMLQVNKSSANDMIKKLSAEGIVVSKKYKPIKITEQGKRKAAEIIRKHRLAEMFLVQIMGFGWEEVHDIAEEMEHIDQEALFDRMDELLGFPTTDPHGSPIPDKDGNFNRPAYKTLSQIDKPTTVVLKALRNSEKAFLIFLNKRALKLNTEIQITHIEEFDESYTVSYGNFSDVVLSKLICDKLLVEAV